MNERSKIKVVKVWFIKNGQALSQDFFKEGEGRRRGGLQKVDLMD